MLCIYKMSSDHSINLHAQRDTDRSRFEGKTYTDRSNNLHLTHLVHKNKKKIVNVTRTTQHDAMDGKALYATVCHGRL